MSSCWSNRERRGDYPLLMNRSATVEVRCATGLITAFIEKEAEGGSVSYLAHLRILEGDETRQQEQ